MRRSRHATPRAHFPFIRPMPMRRIARALLLCAPLPVAAQTPRLPSVKQASVLADSLARAFVASGGAPSISVAVVRGTDTILFKAYGTADLEQNVPATPRTVYRVGSVTKQFTAAMVLQLVEQGKVRLDDSIAQHLPALPEAWHAVTVRQLLNHTSGIPSYTDLGDPWIRRLGEEMPPDTLIALTAHEPMWFAPGTKWKYDNTGYIVLGMLVEKITGKSWDVNLAERFTTPLGLTDTRDCLTTPLIARRAPGYDPAGTGWANTRYLAMSQPFSAGALCSTIGDLVRWNRALHGGQVVSASSYALMITPEGAAMHGELKYGFGLGRDTIAGRPMITHGGGIFGFITGNAWIPSEKLSVTVLANSGGAHSGDLLKQLVRTALGAPLR
jgi:D-alanyl-D-alanine carboxypeptidase